jgi:hypothetical protein
MVLIALAILFAGLGALSWSSDSDSDDASLAAAATTIQSAAPTTTVSKVPAAVAKAPTSTTSAAPTTVSTPSATSTPVVPKTTARAEASTTAASTTPSAVSADVVGSVPVRVLNNSAVAGLASDTATELRADGWTVTGTGNFADRNLSESTVYYGDQPGAKEAATMIAKELGATAAPATPEIAAAGDGVTVILTGE